MTAKLFPPFTNQLSTASLGFSSIVFVVEIEGEEDEEEEDVVAE